ncbi:MULTISPECIES: CmcI family methyltransferase [unclassified Synechocystis]|uniref:CmcI family methyltransferase n=1 Tax=unclassified Synechocystis TaxID=2640012 RepID=UPI0003FF25FA|nr:MULTISPECIES: CmcI family methyltransferase [unclassified Synechocystis]AIE74673.1 Cephalosporin hydroxylase [Synechocystis sp. PCC 6714]MCT0253972.1 cephalosporin hydroxylase family protein [Synechocystis sp. CS-94]
MINQFRKIKNKIFRNQNNPNALPWKNPANHKQIIDDFHGLYYDSFRSGKTWADTWFLGVKTEKCPLDLWLYQELIFNLKPDLIIETGTRFGGSALFLASICDLVNKGLVVTIDIDTEPERPNHSRIKYISGSSTDPLILQKLKSDFNIDNLESILVILDSDHSESHVFEELKLYSPLVTIGSYIIVEDSNINGNPVLPNCGPGPMEAIQRFVNNNKLFIIDSFNEKLLLSFSPSGFLKRVQ